MLEQSFREGTPTERSNEKVILAAFDDYVGHKPSPGEISSYEVEIPEAIHDQSPP